MEDPGDFFIYDELTFEPLASLGWRVESIPWNRARVDWSLYEIVVIRSTWDYQDHVKDFLAVLQAIEASPARLLNPLSIVRWNLEKTYLKEVEAQGIRIVPTQWWDSLDYSDITAICRKYDAEEAIAKPTIGANADDTFRLRADISPREAHEALTCFHNRPVMLQPFLPSVLEGESSLFYFGGEYSHTVLKTPKSGDFRVQEEHGASLRSMEAPKDLLVAGRQVIDTLEEQLLYARVDFVRLPDGTPVVMELELIEPSLYFNYDSDAPIKFAKALNQMADQRGGR